MSLPDLLPALRPVLAEFDRLGIAYYVGGSIASSIYGEPRSTLDVDLGADLPESVVRELASQWGREFYVSEPAMRDAVQRARCFNLIHLATSLKVDIFVCGTDAFNASVLKRRVSRTVAVGDESLSIWMATPEDVILHKLVWYRKGGEISERQWRDISGILKHQQDRLDAGYLSEWADRLQVRDLWERARNTMARE
ncbi:MAG TPA: hypothetical protein VGI80_06275 [Pyrinomonadaceae bacterium]